MPGVGTVIVTSEPGPAPKMSIWVDLAASRFRPDSEISRQHAADGWLIVRPSAGGGVFTCPAGTSSRASAGLSPQVRRPLTAGSRRTG
jgi:hypothetical protein